jgi:predicted Zn-dependent peptidase
VIRYQITLLANQIRMGFVPVPGSSLAYCTVTARSGTCFEPREQTGLGHFAEHVLMRGNATFPDSASLHRAAAQAGGVLHASTHKDGVYFSLSFLPARYEQAFRVLASLITSPTVSDEMIALERQIILHEADLYLSTEDEPRGERGLADWLRYGDSVLGRPIIGFRRTIKEFSSLDLRNHIAAHFSGSNIAVAFAGSLPPEALDTAVRLFSDVRPGERVALQPLRIPRADRIDCSSPHGAPSVHLHVELAGQPTDIELQLLHQVFADGGRSPFHLFIAEELGLAYTVDCPIWRVADVSFLTPWANIRRNEATEVVRAMVHVLKRHIDEALPESDLEAIKTRLAAVHLNCIDSPPWLATNLSSALLLDRKPFGLLRGRNFFDGLTTEELRASVRRVLSRSDIRVIATGDGILDFARFKELASDERFR